MKEIKKIVSDNIGMEGNSFFCRRCGKAGYPSMASVKGHLGMCKGKAIQRAGGVQLATASSSSVGTASIARLGGISTSQLTATAGPGIQLAPADIDYGELSNRVASLENEYNHLLAENNVPVNSDDWVSRNKDILIILGIGIGLYLLLQQSKCNCGARANGIGSTLVNRAAGKAVDYGLNKLFK
jgi:hypothetical protein